MTNYYSLLGISKNASDDEIKNAYRKMAKIHHPDRGGNKEKFQKIQEAYEVLSDKKKKNNYDNPNADINNMFPFDHPFFKHHKNDTQQQIKRSDHIYTCKISLKDAYLGITKKFKVQRSRICNGCKQKCNICNGSGQHIQEIRMGPFTQILQQTCNSCGGSGKKTISSDCSICNSNRTINEEKIFEVNLKPGIESGEKIVFEEWGEQPVKDNEIAGSFIVNIIVEEDKLFKRSGLDLLYTIDLSLKESFVGTTIKIPHFDNELNLDTKGFGIINPNKEYIIFNKGMCKEDKKGHLKLHFKIKYIERNFTTDELNLLNQTFEKINLT